MPIKPIEVFQFLKPEYNWIAMWPFNQAWRAYETKPERLLAPLCDGWRTYNGWIYIGNVIDIDYTGDWKDSLFSRDDYEKSLCEVCKKPQGHLIKRHSGIICCEDCEDKIE